MRRIANIVLLLFMGAAPALADTAVPQRSPPNPAWIASPEAIARTRAIVANTKGTDGVFTVGDDGSIRHVQSRLLCPPKFPNVDFWHAEIFDSSLGPGSDIGCDYGRNGPDGYAISKLTIFATKVPDDLTLDQAFQHYRGQLLRVAPGAKSEGQALDVKNDGSSSFPDIRSEEFAETRDGQDYTTQILVAVGKGWVFEIRTTFEGASNRVVIPQGGTAHDGALAMGDRMMLAAAYVVLAAALAK